MNKVIRLKDDSIHIVQSTEYFLNLVEEIMGEHSRLFIEEEIILNQEDKEEDIEYYKELLDRIADIAKYGY